MENSDHTAADDIQLSQVKKTSSRRPKSLSRNSSTEDRFANFGFFVKTDDISTISSGDISFKSHHSRNGETESTKKRRYVIRGVIYVTCFVLIAIAVIAVAVYFKLAPDWHLTPLLTTMTKTGPPKSGSVAGNGTITSSADSSSSSSSSNSNSAINPSVLPYDPAPSGNGSTASPQEDNASSTRRLTAALNLGMVEPATNLTVTPTTGLGEVRASSSVASSSGVPGSPTVKATTSSGVPGSSAVNATTTSGVPGSPTVNATTSFGVPGSPAGNATSSSGVPESPAVNATASHVAVG